MLRRIRLAGSILCSALNLTLWVAIHTHPAQAQLGTATISGNVTDSSGAVVVGASVTAVNNGTGFQRQTVSGDQGQYNLPGLNPGSYNLTVEFPGFRRAELKAVTLQVDQNARLNVALEIGQVSETVEIAGRAPLVESSNATLGAVVDTQKILALPLNGRNFLQLAKLVPGVTTGTEGGGGGADGFSANGLRADQNSFQIDGTSNSDPLNNTDHVQAEYRFAPGIQNPDQQLLGGIRQGRRSAGERGHQVRDQGVARRGVGVQSEQQDTVAQLLRPRFARLPCDKSDPSPTRKACAPQYNQNQFGGNLGGPVPFLKNTFFFVNEEEYWQRRGGSTVTQVMTPDQRNGDFSRFLQTATTTADAMGRTFRRGQLFDPRSSRQVTASNGQLQYVRDPYPGNIVPKDQFDPVAAKMVANTDLHAAAERSGPTDRHGRHYQQLHRQPVEQARQRPGYGAYRPPVHAE